MVDDPGPDQLAQVSPTEGVVEILIDAVNDAPRPGDDSFITEEGDPLTISISGPDGILANDVPGPQDEIDDGQTVSFVSSDSTSFRDGTIEQIGDSLVYTPPAFFSGEDQFNYTIEDSFGETAEGTVFIAVVGVNNPPSFVGVGGVSGADQLSFDESQDEPRVEQFNLDTWFNDPDGDALTFTVDSSDPQVVTASVNGSTLELEMPPHAFGEATLSLTATDPLDESASATVIVNVANVADSPVVTGSLGPINVDENAEIIRTLSDVFSDPDGDELEYSLARLGNLVNPTPEQIADHPLIQAITFSDDQVEIVLEPFQSGTEEIEIAATDGTFTVSDSFTLNVASVPDPPIGGADAYDVPLGSVLRVLDPAEGLLANDFDPDDDSIEVDLGTVTQPANGTVEVEADGTFIYASSGGQVGESDNFTYRVVDSTGRSSEPIEVTVTLVQSEFQNPNADLRWDVNADSVVSPIDALRIINLLSRVLPPGESSMPVSELTSSPPDFYDVNGDGRVSSLDALQVINEIQRRAASGFVGGGEGETAEPRTRAATTTAYAAASTLNLPNRNIEPVEEMPLDQDPRDTLMATGVEIMRPRSTAEVDWVREDPTESTAEDTDEALSLLLDEVSHD